MATPIENGEIYRIWFIEPSADAKRMCYVGQTRQDGGSWERVQQHITDAVTLKDSCPLLDQAIRDNGTTALRWQILERGIKTQEELDDAERYYIRAFNSQTPNGYNIKAGGQGARSGQGSPIFRHINRLATRIFKRNLNRATWKTVGVSFFDLEDISKIIGSPFKKR